MPGTLPDFVYCILICIMFEKCLKMTLRERTLKDSVEQICTYVNTALGVQVWEHTSVCIYSVSYLIIFTARLVINPSSVFFPPHFPLALLIEESLTLSFHGILTDFSRTAVSLVCRPVEQGLDDRDRMVACPGLPEVRCGQHSPLFPFSESPEFDSAW